MIRFGDAFKCCVDPYHRGLVISDPSQNGGWVVFVVVTTDDGTWPDRDCLLTPEDWNELKHVSTVAFSTARVGGSDCGERLLAQVKAQKWRRIPSPSEAVLRRIVEAAKVAHGLSPKALQYLPAV